MGVGIIKKAKKEFGYEITKRIRGIDILLNYNKLGGLRKNS